MRSADVRARMRFATVVAALMVVAWAGVATAANGDPITAGQTTTATARTILKTNQSTGNGLQVTLGGTTTGAAIRGLNTAAGNGVSGTTADASSYGVFGQNTGNGSGVYGLAGGGGNGVYGSTGAPGASGVYGENTGGGFGIAGRSNQMNGVAVYGEAIGGGNAHAISAVAASTGGAIVATNNAGPALELHSLGLPPIAVDSTVKVFNLNADRVDGASILSNRIISTTQNEHILQMPGFGDINVDGCDHANIRFVWSSGGPNAYVTYIDLASPGDFAQGVFNIYYSSTHPHHFVTMQLARYTGSITSIATITVTTNAADCVFAATAVVQPG